jgi:hypothetical protein
MKVFCTITLSLVLQIDSLHAQLVTLEPDNYTNGTVLNTIISGMSLKTAGANNLPILPFNVKAITDDFGYAPTGQKVFAQESVPFFNNDARLLMNFSSPVAFLSIDFAGGSGQTRAETGELDVYDANNQLLGSYLTQPRFGGQVETMSLSRPTADVAWAVAYVPANLGSFGRLDHLVFSPVPEPSTLGLATLFLAALGVHALRRRHGK